LNERNELNWTDIMQFSSVQFSSMSLCSRVNIIMTVSTGELQTTHGQQLRRSLLEPYIHVTAARSTKTLDWFIPNCHIISYQR